jgi:acyl CoA:acetate/3-ketoacid CoA transferase alpha subunit
MSAQWTSIEAAAALVQDHHQVVMSAGNERPPMALLRQIVRQGTTGLRAVGVVGGEINLDFLVGAGAADVIDTCSVTLGPFARTGPNFARHVTAGRITAMDNT